MDPFALVDVMREALERRDADRLAAVLHPDVELHLYSQPGVIAGRDAAHAWYREAFASRMVFEGEATPELGEDGSLVARGRVCWYDDGVLRDWPACTPVSILRSANRDSAASNARSGRSRSRR